jgi:archaeal flagellar protein FlaI
MAAEDYVFDEDSRRIKVDCINCIYGASIEDYPVCMSRTVDKLIEVKKADRIILSQAREFEYDDYQTKILKEIADVITYLTKRRRVALPSNLGVSGVPDKLIAEFGAYLNDIITNMIGEDPIGAYVKLKREIRSIEQKIKTMPPNIAKGYHNYLENGLKVVSSVLEQTTIIKLIKDRIVGHKIGDRTLYREIFHPTIRPNFMLTRYMLIPPKNAKKIDEYLTNEGIRIQIYKVPDQLQTLYHILPPEFNLNEEEYTILDSARRFMAAHKPKETEFANPKKMRDTFSDIGKDLIFDLAEQAKIELTPQSIDMLSSILTRYTAGYGILEIILGDEDIQDIYLNAPMGEAPIYLYHGKYEECITNIIPTQEDAESWATRFRIESGRPLDEANPVLDTEIEVPGGRARVAAVTKTLSPDGLSFALRRHRDKPWSLPLLIKTNTLNALAAGLISFLIDGARTMLIAGTRSAGKSSLLGAVMTELMTKVRILTVEDTLELPVKSLAKLGYDIQSLKSRSILTNVESEVSADDAIRTSLRLGDSALIIGEVRSVEAKALYESMRIGALANLVAGTIHGDSAYGVFDRVVNDLEVKATSFKATDIIVVANRLKSSDGLKTFRRIVSIVEVTKDWDENPQKEKGFEELMRYNADTDVLEPTERFLNGESYIINQIANNTREFKDNWQAVFENIKLREKIKQTIVNYSSFYKDEGILEADFTVVSNGKFHTISSDVLEEYGKLDSERIFARWDNWIKEQIVERRRKKDNMN